MLFKKDLSIAYLHTRFWLIRGLVVNMALNWLLRAFTALKQFFKNLVQFKRALILFIVIFITKL